MVILRKRLEVQGRHPPIISYLPFLVPNTVAHDSEHYYSFLHLGARVCLNSLETIFPRENEQRRTKNLEENAMRYSVIIRMT